MCTNNLHDYFHATLQNSMPITRNTMASKGKGSELQINKIGNFIKRISIGFHADPHIPVNHAVAHIGYTIPERATHIFYWAFQMRIDGLFTRIRIDCTTPNGLLYLQHQKSLIINLESHNV